MATFHRIFKNFLGFCVREGYAGHLTVLDDPDLRALAQQHADSTELLKEDWILAVPG